MHFSAFLHLGETIYLKTFSAPSLKFNDALDITGLHKYQTAQSLTQFLPYGNPLFRSIRSVPGNCLYLASLSPKIQTNKSWSNRGQTYKAVVSLTISPVVG